MINNNRKYSNVIKFVIYFLLFFLILYIEYSLIEMQTGSSIEDKDRSGGTGFIAMWGFVCIVPFYILYDIAIHKTLYRLVALLLQSIFCLWSLFWFRKLLLLRYDMQYNNMVTTDGFMPVGENNFYDCWTMGYVIVIYLTVIMIVSGIRQRMMK